MNYKEFDKNLIDKYYQGKCTPEEKETVEYWFADIKYNKNISEATKQEWEQTSTEGDKKRLLTNILFKIHSNIFLEECRRIKDTRWSTKAKSAFTYASAAVVVLLLVMNIWLWQGQYKLPGNQPVYTEIHAPFGSRIKFNLPDGSSGWLNSGSSLKFPTRFDGHERKVELNGEGYFNVKPNPKKSFVVSTKFYQVRALGTSFNVEAYSGPDPFEEVTLETGKVQIERIKQDGSFRKISDMKPGQHAVLSYSKNSIKTSYVKTDKYTGWKNGKLIFRNDPLERVIRCLERNYNVQIKVEDDQLFKYHFHATFEEETLFETLRLLKLSSAIDYKICKREKKEDGTYKKRKIILFSKK